MTKLLIEKIKNKFNNRYEFNDRKSAFNNVRFKNNMGLSWYISQKNVRFNITEIQIYENDLVAMKNKIMIMNFDK